MHNQTVTWGHVTKTMIHKKMSADHSDRRRMVLNDTAHKTVLVNQCFHAHQQYKCSWVKPSRPVCPLLDGWICSNVSFYISHFHSPMVVRGGWFWGGWQGDKQNRKAKSISPKHNKLSILQTQQHHCSPGWKSHSANGFISKVSSKFHTGQHHQIPQPPQIVIVSLYRCWLWKRKSKYTRKGNQGGGISRLCHSPVSLGLGR